MGKVDQGVVVLWMAKHFWKGNLAYIGFGGEGLQVRDVFHVDDLYQLVKYQIHHIDKVNGEIFCVGGGEKVSVSLKELSEFCIQITGNVIPIQKIPDTRVADIPLYISDTRKVEAICGWRPQKSVEDILTDIYQWMRENESDLRPILA
jgi:CDP-paratose 2-epimerase